MVLGSSVNITQDGYLSLCFPAGLMLTDESLNQLHAHQAEFIDIEQTDTRRDEQIAVDMALAAHRVLQIFAGADLNDPTMASLFNQALCYRCA